MGGGCSAFPLHCCLILDIWLQATSSLSLGSTPESVAVGGPLAQWASLIWVNSRKAKQQAPSVESSLSSRNAWILLFQQKPCVQDNSLPFLSNAYLLSSHRPRARLAGPLTKSRCPNEDAIWTECHFPISVIALISMGISFGVPPLLFWLQSMAKVAYHSEHSTPHMAQTS